MTLNGETVYQIIGVDVTAEERLNRQLDVENARLAKLNARLKQYSKNVEAVVREREILLAKARIHDEWGRTLLRTRRLLRQENEDSAAVREAWRQNIRLICSPSEENPVATSMEQLEQAALAIGVIIQKCGAFPKPESENAQLMVTAAHECLTNLVRHADGSRLEMQGYRTSDGWRVEYRNDGAPPAAPIAEGGGLSSLRRRVEAAGGTMEIRHEPQFALILNLPEKKEACV